MKNVIIIIAIIISTALSNVFAQIKQSDLVTDTAMKIKIKRAIRAKSINYTSDKITIVKRSIPIYKLRDSLFTGKAYNYHNGDLRDVITYVNGIRNGETRNFSGGIVTIENYKNGLLHGACIRMNPDSSIISTEKYYNGILIHRINSENEEENYDTLGIAHGTFRIKIKNHKQFTYNETTYFHSRPVKTKLFGPNGQLVKTTEFDYQYLDIKDVKERLTKITKECHYDNKGHIITACKCTNDLRATVDCNNYFKNDWKPIYESQYYSFIGDSENFFIQPFEK